MTKRDFDAEAATWDSVAPRRLLALGLAEAILQAVELRATDTLLDYGAGSGLVSLRLSPQVAKVICADSSRGMLDVIEGKLSQAGIENVSTLLLDLERGQRAPKVDVIVSTMALHHIQDTAALVAALRAALLPGGRVALADLDTEAGDFHQDNTGVAHFGFEREALMGLLRAAGFEELSAKTAYEMVKPVQGTDKTFTMFLITGRVPS